MVVMLGLLAVPNVIKLEFFTSFSDAQNEKHIVLVIAASG